MTKRMFFFAAALALVAVSYANAQVDSGNNVMFEWGAIHMVPGQEVVLNLSLSDEGGPLTLPVEFELTDKNGKTVYRNTVMVSSGQAISLAVGPEYRTSTGGLVGSDVRTTVPADIYAAIAPEIRVLQPCLKIAYPPGPSAPVLNRLTPTLELMDVFTGRVLGFANNPHAIIGVLSN